jgi:protein involved in polysaccharide export with SLBB domain
MKMLGCLVGFLALCSVGALAQPLAESTKAMSELDDATPLHAGDFIYYCVHTWFPNIESKGSLIHLRIHPDGIVLLPDLGEQRAEGLTPKVLAGRIKSLLEGEYYHQAAVTIELDPVGPILAGPPAPESKAFTIYGEVMHPGTYEIDPRLAWSINQAVFSMGSSLGIRAPRHCILRRRTATGEVSETHRLKEMIMGRDPWGDQPVKDGDVFRVAP